MTNLVKTTVLNSLSTVTDRLSIKISYKDNAGNDNEKTIRNASKTNVGVYNDVLRNLPFGYTVTYLGQEIECKAGASLTRVLSQIRKTFIAIEVDKLPMLDNEAYDNAVERIKDIAKDIVPKGSKVSFEQILQLNQVFTKENLLQIQHKAMLEPEPTKEADNTGNPLFNLTNRELREMLAKQGRTAKAGLVKSELVAMLTV